jgi:hypothetical protein
MPRIVPPARPAPILDKLYENTVNQVASMSEFNLPVHAIKGRGTAIRLAHRFSRDSREAFDDGWPSLDEAAGRSTVPGAYSGDFRGCEGPPSPATTLPTSTSSISINPYRGCEHGCIYCYARPTHSYLGLSPGLDFETRLIAKRNIAEVLSARAVGTRRTGRTALNVGTVTDCYQPIERELQAHALNHRAASTKPATRFSLITKSSGVERDLDLHRAHGAAHGLAAVYVTVTTLDAQLSRTPGAARGRAAPAAAHHPRAGRRGRAGGRERGAPDTVSSTTDMEQVLEAAWDAGARTRVLHRAAPALGSGAAVSRMAGTCTPLSARTA